MNAIVQTEQKQPTALDKFRGQFEARRAEIAGSLPAHIPYERYARVIMNAVAQNPDLLLADRASLLIAVAKAATDGLLCDGREAALVIFRNKRKGADGRDEWFDAVQYMPMVAGLLKKCRNSGELSSIVARVVYGGDKFRNWIDDSGEHIEYEAADEQDRSVVRRVFAMAKLKDGSIEVEVLSPADVEKIRSVSRSKDKGPWAQWWDQMAIKSAIRRLSKRLPLNTDLDDLIRRDDSLYDLEGASDRNRPRDVTPKTANERLDALVAGAQGRQPLLADAETGEIIEQAPSAPAAAPQPAPRVGDDKARDEATLMDLQAEGVRRAAEGPEALAEFEEGLSAYEVELMGPHIGGLRRMARGEAVKGSAS